MSTDPLRNELQASFKNRAILYYLIFDELREDQHLTHESTTTFTNGYVQVTYRS